MLTALGIKNYVSCQRQPLTRPCHAKNSNQVTAEPAGQETKS